MNRNFGFKFGDGDLQDDLEPCNDTYQGKSGFSEKETKAIKNIIEKENIFIWMHFDGLSNQVIIPWTYSSNLSDFGSEYLNNSYAELKSLMKNKVDNSENLGLGTHGGSLVDYGASKEIFTFQLSYEDDVVAQDEIIDKCQSNIDDLMKILKNSLNPLNISGSSWNVSNYEANDTHASYAILEISYTASNPNKVNHSIEISMNMNASNPNLTLEEIETNVFNQNSDGSVDGRRLLSESFSIQIPELSNVQIQTYINISGDSGDFSLDVAIQLHLSDSTSKNGYDYLSSELLSISNITGSIPDSSEDSSSVTPAGSYLFSRSWYLSSSHHEGVAVGLVTLFLSLFLLLFILYILKLYKAYPAGEGEGDDEPSSDYIKKEVKTVQSNKLIEKNFDNKSPDRSFDHMQGMKAEASPFKKVESQAKPIESISIPVRSKFSIDEDEKRTMSPVINVPNRPKPQPSAKTGEVEVQVKKPESPKIVYSTPSFNREAEVPVPVIKTSSPAIKAPSPAVKVEFGQGEKIEEPKSLAPMVYGNAPEFNSKHDIKPPPSIFHNPIKEDIVLKPSDSKRPSGPVILESGSDDEIEILHAPQAKRPGLEEKPNYHFPVEKSDDGEFEIIKVTEKDKDNGKSMPGTLFRPQVHNLGVPPVHLSKKDNHKDSDSPKIMNSSKSPSSSSSSSSSSSN